MDILILLALLYLLVSLARYFNAKRRKLNDADQA